MWPDNNYGPKFNYKPKMGMVWQSGSRVVGYINETHNPMSSNKKRKAKNRKASKKKMRV